MTPTISGITPFFIVANVPATLSFYRDMLGFEVTFRGPTPEDEFFGIVRRDGAMIMFKAPGLSGGRVVQLERHLDHRPAEPHAREEPLRRLVLLGGRQHHARYAAR